MIKLGFNEEMIELLSSLKGKKLKSFEWEAIELGRFPLFAVRINTGRFALDLFSEISDDTPEEYEDVSCFRCEKSNLHSAFYHETLTKEYLINETIKGISIVTDTVWVDGRTECIMDIAVLLQTSYTTFALSKTWFMGEAIEINYEGRYYSEEKALKDWQGALGDSIEIHREIKVI